MINCSIILFHPRHLSFAWQRSNHWWLKGDCISWDNVSDLGSKNRLCHFLSQNCPLALRAACSKECYQHTRLTVFCCCKYVQGKTIFIMLLYGLITKSILLLTLKYTEHEILLWNIPHWEEKQGFLCLNQIA